MSERSTDVCVGRIKVRKRHQASVFIVVFSGNMTLKFSGGSKKTYCR